MNKLKILISQLYISSFVAICLSCSTSEEPQDHAQVSVYPTTVISSDQFDTLYTFAAISDVDHLSNGNIAILDRLSARAYIFSSEGEYLTNVGFRGTGPGEFNSPDCMVPVSEDSLLIFDKSIRVISVFNEDGVYISDIDDIINSPFPYWCKYNGQGRYVGGMMFINSNSEGYDITYSVCAVSELLCPIDTFFTNTTPLIRDDITSMLNNSVFSCAFASDNNGNVFVAPTSDSDYSIYGYNSEGECFLSLTRNIQRVKKSEQELSLESERFNRMLRARNPGSISEYSPPEYLYMIPPQGLHVDNCARLWVLRGTCRQPIFDVYNYSGSLLFSAEIMGIDQEETIDVLWWSISEHGLLAFSVDPYMFPKVYVYDLPVDI